MLVLSRKVGDRIRIGKGDSAVYIEVVAIQAGRVRIGVEAPPFVPVDREEVAYAKDKAEAEKGGAAA